MQCNKNILHRVKTDCAFEIGAKPARLFFLGVSWREGGVKFYNAVFPSTYSWRSLAPGLSTFSACLYRNCRGIPFLVLLAEAKWKIMPLFRLKLIFILKMIFGCACTHRTVSKKFDICKKTNFLWKKILLGHIFFIFPRLGSGISSRVSAFFAWPRVRTSPNPSNWAGGRKNLKMVRITAGYQIH